MVALLGSFVFTLLAYPEIENPFHAQEPTEERPYYYIRYDEKTKAANPDRSPASVGLIHTVNGDVAWDINAKGILDEETLALRPGEKKHPLSRRRSGIRIKL